MKPEMKTLVAAVLLSSLLLATVTAAAGAEEPDPPEVLMQFRVDVDGAQHTFQVTVPSDPRQIVFTQEQIELLRAADTITGYFSSGSEHPSGEDGSYWAIEGPGINVQLHFAPLDAVNLETVVSICIIWVAVITALAGALGWGLGAFAVGLALGFLLQILCVDYRTMYGHDHNRDKSFDLWIELAWYSFYYILGGTLWGRTPNYKWQITLHGAFAYKKYTPTFIMPIDRRGIGGFGEVRIK